MSARSILTSLTALALACSGALLGGSAVAESHGQAARSSPRWGPVRTLAPNTSSTDLAVDGQGTTTVVWTSTGYPTQVVARQRFADGTWGTKTVLGPGGSPQVVADHRGRTTVVWLDGGVVSARHTPAGGWSEPTTVSEAVPTRAGDKATPVASQLDVAADRAGDVVAVWSWGDDEGGVKTKIRSAYRPARGAWRTAVDVTPANGADEPKAGIAGDGTALVVYGVQAFGEPQALASRIRGQGGRWSSSSPVTAEGYGHHVAVAADGRAVVVFSPDFSAVQASTRTPGRAWGKPRTLVGGGELNDADVAVGPGGRFVVGIARNEGRVDVVERGRHGGWSDRVRLAAEDTVASDVMVTVGDAGDAFVGWGSYGVYGRYRPHGGTWSKRFTARPDSGVDVLEWAGAAAGPNGDVAVLWDQEEAPLRMRVLLTP